MAGATTITQNRPKMPWLLGQTEFTKLWAAQALSQVAQHLLNFTLIIRAFDLASGTNLANIAVGLVIVSFGLPSVLFAAVAGVYVDHWDRRRVLWITNIARAMLVLIYIAVNDNLILILIISFVIATTTQFFTPAEAASIPLLVPRKLLVKANSIFVFTIFAAFVAGYSLAVPVLGLYGPDKAYLLVAGAFLAAGGLCFWLPPLTAPFRHHEGLRKLLRSTWSELARNFTSIKERPKVFGPILQLTITQSATGVLVALAPALALALVKLRLQEASHILIAPAAVGMITAVLVLGRVTKYISTTKLAKIGLGLAGLCFLLLSQLYRLYELSEASIADAQVKVLAVILMALLGAMMATVMTCAQTLLQENTHDEERGSVFGVLNMMINIAATLPVLLAGILADAFGPLAVVFGLGLIVLSFNINLSNRWLKPTAQVP